MLPPIPIVVLRGGMQRTTRAHAMAFEGSRVWGFGVRGKVWSATCSPSQALPPAFQGNWSGQMLQAGGIWCNTKGSRTRIGLYRNARAHTVLVQGGENHGPAWAAHTGPITRVRHMHPTSAIGRVGRGPMRAQPWLPGLARAPCSASSQIRVLNYAETHAKEGDLQASNCESART